MAKKSKEEMVFEDISSSSPKNIKPIAELEEHSNRAFKNIDKTIKTLAFVVSIGIFLIFAVLAAVLIILDKIFFVVSIGLIVVGAILAIIIMFLIYGTGHIISQNNEILKKL